MKRVFCLAVAVGILIMINPLPLEAGAYKSAGIGTRALLRGGGIAGADDYSGLYWNPATLTQVNIPHFAVEPHLLYLMQTDGNSVKNYDTANYSNLQGDTFQRVYNVAGTAIEPSSFSDKDAIYSSLSPTTSFGSCFKLKGFNLGLGMYTPAALSTDWKDTVSDLVNNAVIQASYFSEIKLTAYNISIAKELNSYLSLGAGLNYIYMQTKVEAEKVYGDSSNPLYYRFDYKEEAEGDGFEPTVGLLYKPIANLKFGAVYRGGAGIRLKGDSYYKHTYSSLDENSDYIQDYDFPNSWGVGLAYEPNPRLTIILDWERTGWHKVKRKLDYDLVGGASLKDTEIDWQWKDSDQVRLGGEYRVNSALSLLGSIWYDESPLSDETVSITNVIDVDKIYLFFGLCYNRDKFQFNAGYSYGFGNDTIDGVEYELDMHNLMAGVNYSF